MQLEKLVNHLTKENHALKAEKAALSEHASILTSQVR